MPLQLFCLNWPKISYFWWKVSIEGTIAILIGVIIMFLKFEPKDHLLYQYGHQIIRSDQYGHQITAIYKFCWHWSYFCHWGYVSSGCSHTISQVQLGISHILKSRLKTARFKNERSPQFLGKSRFWADIALTTHLCGWKLLSSSLLLFAILGR